MKNIKEANDVLKHEGVKWVQGHFTDLLGYLRSYTSPVEEYIEQDMWKNGISIDGSSVGFCDISKSDMNVVPDVNTLQILPWTSGEQKTARVILDIMEAKTWAPFAGAPRNIARRADSEAMNAGFSHVWFSPELEYYLFKSINDAIVQNESWNIDVQANLVNITTLSHSFKDCLIPRYLQKPKESYFIAPPIDITDEFRNDFASALLKLDIPVKYHHHETGSSQVEVEFRAVSSAVEAGDCSTLYKFVARNIAEKFGFLPTFMPKPISGDSGSGMHAHMTLWKKGKTCFYDKDDPNSLSQIARYFIGGILDHAQGMCAITNPTINSYKRLVPGSEAPVYIAWSSMNRSALIRVPDHTDDPLTVNCEARHPDPSANPYLVFAVLLNAGLDGIKKKLDPGEPVNANIYKLSLQKQKEYGINQLPATLGAALDYLETDEMMQHALGKKVFDDLLELKRKEWVTFCNIVSPWEHYKYFDI